MTRLTDIDEDVGLRFTRSGFMRATMVSVAALSAGGAASLAPSRARAAPPKGDRHALSAPHPAHDLPRGPHAR